MTPRRSTLLALSVLAALLAGCAGTDPGNPRRIPEGHTGPFTTWWSDTKVREEGEYLDGQRNGEIRIYHPDGSLQEQSAYVRGVPDGKRVRYHPGGVIQLVEHISEGVLDGERREFDETGRPTSFQTWAEGRRNGPQMTWHANGRPEGEGFWRGDLPVGHWRHWNEDGRLTSDEWFWAADGRPVGALETVYADNGVVTAQGLKRWVDGHWVGWRTYWHKNGVQSGLVDYRDDVRHGRDLSWNASGLPLVEGQRRDDRKVGVWTTYDARGRPERTTDHGDGARAGGGAP